jgi:hypothetical protein
MQEERPPFLYIGRAAAADTRRARGAVMGSAVDPVTDEAAAQNRNDVIQPSCEGYAHASGRRSGLE